MDWEHEGSISHGTMRARDLIPAFMDALKVINPMEHEKALRDGGDYWLTLIAAEQNAGHVLITDQGEDDLGYFHEETLWPIMEEQTPVGYYFGAHVGDGSDVGFWRDGDDE